MRILLVEDDPACQLSTAMVLRHLGYNVVTADRAEEGLARFDPELHDLVVTDNRMPGMSGVELATQLKRRSPATPVVIYSGCPEADRGAADAFLAKPGSVEEFQMVLSALRVATRRERPVTFQALR
jgi:CheY-like chemotaxis protein